MQGSSRVRIDLELVGRATDVLLGDARGSWPDSLITSFEDYITAENWLKKLDIGYVNWKVGAFEEDLRILQRYLDGESVSLGKALRSLGILICLLGELKAVTF
jgi:hypothetical protein